MDTILTTYVSNVSSSISGDIAGLAVACATIAVLYYSLQIVRGEAHPLWGWLNPLIRMSLVAGVALGAGYYNGYIVTAIHGLNDGLINAISLGSGSSMGDLLDNTLQPFGDLTLKLQDRFEDESGIFPDFAMLAALIIVAISQAIISLVAMGMALLAKIALAICLAIAPIFILCAAWTNTQRYFETWLNQTLSYVVLNSIVAAVVTMMFGFISDTAAKIDAGFFDENVSIISSTISLLCLCCGAAIVLLNAPSMASALTGGSSLAGIGRDLYRAASQKISGSRGASNKQPSSSKGDKNTVSQDSRSTGSSSQSSSSSNNNSGEVPVYRRKSAALSNRKN